MKGRFIIVLTVFLLSINTVCGQNISYGPGYQTILQNNPAFAGSEGYGTLRLSYLNFYPGNNLNLNSVFVSYDSFFPSIHGGAGFFLADDYLGGIINDVRGGFSYAYHLQVGRELFINAGLTASCYYRGFDMSKAILPDQIDPLNGVVYQSAESLSGRGRAVFDVGTGFLVMTGKYMAGLSVLHLATPDLSGNGLQSDRINRKAVLNIAGKFDLNESSHILLRPVLSAEAEAGNLTGGIGSSVENEMFSLSAIFITSTAKTIDLQAGCSFKTGRMLIFYNYKFNIISSRSMMPASLLHQAGVAFSLNNVDKRKIVNTINFPKL